MEYFKQLSVIVWFMIMSCNAQIDFDKSKWTLKDDLE